MTTLLKKASGAPTLKLPGRDMWVLFSPDSEPATRKMSVVTIKVDPGQTVRPCHAHAENEEIIFILRGQGEAWIDGTTSAFRAGDAILFPVGSKHMIRNTSEKALEVLCAFSPPTTPKEYVLYESLGF